MKKHTILFMGTTEYASVCLEKLYHADYSIPLVVTQPDRPKGRGRKTIPPPVKLKAIELGLEVEQPEKIRKRQFYEKLENLDLDLGVTAAYGKILSPKHLRIPKMGVLNVHASLLPDLRGAAPIQWAIIKGYKVTGVTIMKTDPGMDTGPILTQKKIPIVSDDTAGSLERKLAHLGADLLVETIPFYLNGKIFPEQQDHSKATYAPRLSKKDALINWNRRAEEINRLIRGTNPKPGAYTFYKQLLIKIHRTKIMNRIEEEWAKYKPGTILDSVVSEGILVQTGDIPLMCTLVQPESRKLIRGDQLVSGRYVQIGERFHMEASKER